MSFLIGKLVSKHASLTDALEHIRVPRPRILEIVNEARVTQGDSLTLSVLEGGGLVFLHRPDSAKVEIFVAEKEPSFETREGADAYVRVLIAKRPTNEV